MSGARQRKWLLCGFVLLLCMARPLFGQNLPIASDSRNRESRIAKHASELVSQMTLAEKAAQMQDQAPPLPRFDIPAYGWWNEGLHGVAYAGLSTNFPQAIGLAASWDTELLHAVGEAIAVEARAKHNDAVRKGSHARFYGLTFWSPNVNIFRDPRWGRGQETYGEDPQLTAKLAVSFVRGMEGDNPDFLRVIATPKHFAVYSGPEPLRHRFNAQPTSRDLEETYLPAFRAVVTEGRAGSIMCAYNAVDGAPACANSYLLNQTLRHAWGFKGYVVSDCDAVADIFREHQYAPDAASAVAMAVHAGTDLDCGHSYKSIPEAVKRRLLSEADVDQSVRRLFIARMRLGILEGTERGPFARISMAQVDSTAHRALALRAARESIVLLKNEGSILPLAKHGLRIAVVGPAADYLASIHGNYAGTPSNPSVPLNAIRKMWGRANVFYAQGAPFVDGELIPIARNYLAPATSPGAEGLTAEYFKNLNFRGKPVLVRTDPSPNFNFTNVSPGPGVPAKSFAVRWTAWLTPPAPGEYRLGIHLGPCYECRTLVNYRMYLDGKLLLDSSKMASQTAQSDASVPVTFTDRKRHLLRVEYTRNQAGGQVDIVWQAPSNVLLNAAFAAARHADVVVACVGLSTNLEGEQMSVNFPGFAGGDRTSLDLPLAQQRLLRRVAQAGKPFIVVLLNGGALSINWANQHAAAILEAWYPGEEGGTAIAQTLSGENNPSGRLPATFYKSVKDLPPFADYRMRGRTYRYYGGEPLYSFGFGLSYTTFKYAHLRLSKSLLKAGESLTARVLVTNSGKREGDDVVEFYTRRAISGDGPRLSLKVFARVHLEPGKSQWVSATLSPRDLSVVDDFGKRRVAAGAYTMLASGCQPGPACAAQERDYTISGSVDLDR